MVLSRTDVISCWYISDLCQGIFPSILYPIWLILKLNAFKYNLNEHLDKVLFTQRVLILELMEDHIAVHIIFTRTMNVKVCFIFHRGFK